MLEIGQKGLYKIMTKFNFSLWLNVEEIHETYLQAISAMRIKRLHEGKNLKGTQRPTNTDSFMQLKVMNPSFDQLFGVHNDWIQQAAASVHRLNNFPSRSADFVDTLTDTISDVYQLFRKEGHDLKIKLDEIKARGQDPEEKAKELLYYFKNAVTRRWPAHVEETLKNKRHIDYGQGTRTDLHNPSFDSYDDIVRRGSASQLRGGSEDDAPAQTFEPKGFVGGKPTIQADDEEKTTMGDDGTTFIQGIKSELKNMVAQATRSDRRAALQKAYDMVEEIIELRMKGEGNLDQLMDKFEVGVGLEPAGRQTAMNKILNDIKAASAAATESLGLNLQGTVDRLQNRYKQ